MRFDILTLFPDIFPSYFQASVIGQAKNAGRLTIHTWNIRDFATDTHRTVDDSPYGGGAGMVMKIEPIDRALQALKFQIPDPEKGRGPLGTLRPRFRKTIVVSARGKQFTQNLAQDFSKLDQLTLICGRYEGIDQRVVDHLADEELSIGPYVLAGGELAALVVIETVARLLPGVLGNPDSLTEESFVGSALREYPHYTKPAEYRGLKVPEVLLSGNHTEIKKWRENQRITRSVSENR